MKTILASFPAPFVIVGLLIAVWCLYSADPPAEEMTAAERLQRESIAYPSVLSVNVGSGSPTR